MCQSYKRRYKKLKSIKQKPRYHWVCALTWDPDKPDEPSNWMHVGTGDHTKPKEEEGFRVLFLKFHQHKYFFTGWDFDRQRFFVEGRKQNDLARLRGTRRRKSRFLRDMWERQHGYAPRDLAYLHI